MKRCPDCGFRVKENLRDCPLCGVRMLRDSDGQNMTHVSHKHGKDETCLLPNPTEEAARNQRETTKKHTDQKSEQKSLHERIISTDAGKLRGKN